MSLIDYDSLNVELPLSIFKKYFLMLTGQKMEHTEEFEIAIGF